MEKLGSVGNISLIEYLVWLTNPRLRLDITLDDQELRIKILGFSLIYTPDVFADLVRHLATIGALDEAVELPSDEGGSRFPPTRLMRVVHRLRPDLHDRFTLGSEDGRAHYLRWWIEETAAAGVRDLVVPAAYRAALNDFTRLQQPFPLCDLLVMLWRTREDLQTLFDIGTVEGRCGLLIWFLQCGLDETGLRALVEPRAWLWLLDQVGHWPGIPIFLEALWVMRPDLQQAFPRTAPGAGAFLGWFGRQGSVEMAGLVRQLDWIHQSPEPSTSLRPEIEPPVPAVRPGITVFGRRKTDPGQEPADAVAAAFAEHGVAVVRVDVDQPEADGVTPTSVNIFCLGPLDVVRFFLRHGVERFGGGFNIGFWGSDVPEWPVAAQPLFALLDEVWTPSRFGYEALAPVSDVPVVRMPIAVAPHPDPQASRAAFGLPDDRFIFVCCVDFSASVSPQSPFIVIEAFRAAFARGDMMATLVIRAVHPHDNPGVWARLLEVVNGDPDILILNADERNAPLADVMVVADAFVSLHRGDPTGRRIAEAMALGKPVIVTDYAASRDVTGADNACLVRYQLAPVDADYTGFGSGQFWADPDVDAAARQMRRLVGEPEAAKHLGVAGHALVTALHNPMTAGRRYLRRLGILNLP